jgi:hypothetical protein
MKDRTNSVLFLTISSALFFVLGIVSVVLGAGKIAADSTPVPVLTAGLSTSTWIGIAVGIVLAIEIIIWLFLRWLRNRHY